MFQYVRTNLHSVFLQADALPVTQPTVSEHWLYCVMKLISLRHWLLVICTVLRALVVFLLHAGSETGQLLADTGYARCTDLPARGTSCLSQPGLLIVLSVECSPQL